MVQLGDWALPGRIRCYAQRRKPPFFGVFAPYLGIRMIADGVGMRDVGPGNVHIEIPMFPSFCWSNPFVCFFGKFLCSGLGWLDSSSVRLLNIVELFSKNLVDLERSSHLISFELKADRSGTTDRISSGSICQ